MCGEALCQKPCTHAFKKILIRLENCRSMRNYAAVKKLKQSAARFLSHKAKHCGCRKQKVSCCHGKCTSLSTAMLCKIDTYSCINAAWKLAKIVGKSRSYESGELHYCLQTERNQCTDWKLLKSHFWTKHTKLFTAMSSNILLTCQWVRAYIDSILAELGSIISMIQCKRPVIHWHKIVSSAGNNL